jgi:hypothetical protein
LRRVSFKKYKYISACYVEVLMPAWACGRLARLCAS